MTKSLDLGCGHKPKNFFNADEVFGVDVREDVDANIYRADLVIEPIPFGNEVFDFVTAHDFLEHIPRVLYVPHRKNAFVDVMNEVWRVLKMGGQFLSFTPAFPHAPAFRDPTHVNIITDETFPIYFDNKTRAAAIYGFQGAFEMFDAYYNRFKKQFDVLPPNLDTGGQGGAKDTIEEGNKKNGKKLDLIVQATQKQVELTLRNLTYGGGELAAQGLSSVQMQNSKTYGRATSSPVINATNDITRGVEKIVRGYSGSNNLNFNFRRS